MSNCWNSHAAAHIFALGWSIIDCKELLVRNSAETKIMLRMRRHILSQSTTSLLLTLHEPHRRHCVVVFEQDTFILA